MRERLAVMFVLLLAVAACGDDGATTSSPPATDPPATTQPATTTTGSLPTTTSLPPPTTAATLPPTTTTLPATTTQAPAGDLPDDAPPVVAAGPNGIEILGGEVLVPPIVDEPGEWVEAIPDGLGGLVYAAAGDSSQAIWWWPAGAAEPLLVSFKPGRVLHDVALVEGRPTAIVVDNPNPSPDVEPADFVELLDLASGDTTTGRQVGGIEWSALQVAYQDGVFLVSEINHSCGDLVAFDLAGVEAPLPLPEPPCVVHFELPFGGADFGPPGAGLAYVEQRYADTGEAGGELTGADLVVIGDDGAERARIELGSVGGPLDRVDFDGVWAVVESRYDFENDRYLDPRLVDTRTGEVWTLAGNGAHSFRFAPEPLRVGEG